jgi:amidophosphoribosyltransferase
MGFSRKSGIQFEFGLIRNHYIGRTFIEPQQADRDAKVKIKFNSDRDILADQRVVLVDDSIVRATTIRKLCSMMRKSDSRSGASEVHVRIASSPIVNPCYLGMDFPDSDELIASRMSVEEIREFIGADSLEYLSVEEMLECVPNGGKGYCTGCFNGCYPQGMEIPDKKLKC